jgi:hypothetical protein
VINILGARSASNYQIDQSSTTDEAKYSQYGSIFSLQDIQDFAQVKFKYEDETKFRTYDENFLPNHSLAIQTRYRPYEQPAGSSQWVPTPILHFNWILSRNDFDDNTTKYVSSIQITNLQLSLADLQLIANANKEGLVAQIKNALAPDMQAV